MIIVSFGWTSPAILARRKRRTRRQWKLKHAMRFKRGQLFQAWSRSPWLKGARKIAVCRIVRAPYQDHRISDEDWELEGFAYLTEQGLRLGSGILPVELYNEWKRDQESTADLWILDFEILEVFPPDPQVSRQALADSAIAEWAASR